MNIHVKLSELKNIFKRFDSDKDETFQFAEFRLILRDLMFKKELVEVFRKYVGGDGSFETNPDQPIMTTSQLSDFLADSQGEHYAIPHLHEIIKYFAQDNKRKEHKMSFLEFSQLIFSIHNQAFEPMKTRVYQVMSSPMMSILNLTLNESLWELTKIELKRKQLILTAELIFLKW